MTKAEWREVGPGVMVARHKDLDLNCGLVMGSRRVLVIDTATTTAQGQALANAVREVTPLEQVVVNTHAHYDHCFGNSAFRDSQIYAHSGAADGLRDTAEHQRQAAMSHLMAAGRIEDARQLRDTEVVLPFYLIESDVELDLGDRSAHLLFGGRAHTNHDLAIAVPSAGVVFWGDMVEQGADPAMEDCYPLEWAQTLHDLGKREQVRHAAVAVPGHGDIVDVAFVSEQAEQLRHMAAGLREALSNGARDVDTLMGSCRGLGLADQTLRAAAVRVLETTPAGR